jgi:hypothetical protein
MALPKNKLHDVTSQKITLLTNLRKNLKITWIKFVFSAKFYRIFLYLLKGRDTSVGRATHYELDDSLFESRYRDKEFYLFHTPPDKLWGPPNLLYNGYRWSFPG